MLRAQSQGTENLEEDRLSLYLQRNKDGLLECRGRLPSPYPIYIPDTTTFAEKLVQHAHKATLHGGVGLTMAKIREEYWIPRLRRLAKKVIKQCRKEPQRRLSLTLQRQFSAQGEMLLWLLPCVSTMLLKKENFKT